MEPEYKMIKKLQSMIHDRRNRVRLYCRSEYWDKKAEMMYGHAVSMWPNNALNEYYHQEHLQALHDGLGDVKGLHILDVGCGTGRMSRYLAEKGALVHGFDFSIKTVEIAKALSKSSNPSYEVLSLFDLHENQAYDIALSWGGSYCCLYQCRTVGGGITAYSSCVKTQWSIDADGAYTCQFFCIEY
ncbi:class I SAM-dependent methyltransferase [Candidatus Competibacter phosphatis]|uniref:Class I SAM-dependent methyltransferase n=1 Tax=Candidatus Competibacter phosphatis TaxID=221280 RepID=A0ABX1THU3_9GAMM|nr:class I SAM-dependent methyltransferase [Candidatus Competibacter phosphatis]NMQ18943.1 class I SAM-dependent methyltransferase [Candidatus Competibacter phosphatis]